MKIQWLLGLLAISLAGAVFAAGFGTLHGTNELGQSITIDEIELVPNRSHDLYHIAVKNGEEVQDFTYQPCRLTLVDEAADLSEFSCSSIGNSPLAGASYTVKPYGVECNEYIYTCKSGCNDKTPKQMFQGYWECDVGL